MLTHLVRSRESQCNSKILCLDDVKILLFYGNVGGEMAAERRFKSDFLVHLLS